MKKNQKSNDYQDYFDLQTKYIKYQDELQTIYESCYCSDLLGSGHPLDLIIRSKFNDIHQYQYNILENAASYFGMFEDDYEPNFGLMFFFFSSDDLVQQFLAVKNKILESNLSFDNHTFRSYKYGYAVYGYLRFSKETGLFTFWIREFNRIDVNGMEPALVDFDQNEKTRRKALKDLLRVLKKSGITFLNLSEWLGLSEAESNPLILDTRKKFNYPSLKITHFWLKDYLVQKEIIMDYLSSE